MEINKVMLYGNLTRDPETTFLQSGASVCKFSLAVNRNYTHNGEKKQEVLFVDIEAWQKTGELCQQYLVKGSPAFVEGKLKSSTYQTQAGEKRTKTFVAADNVQFGPKRDGAGNQQNQPPHDSYSTAPQQQYSTAAVSEAAAFSDDDLPF